MGKIMKNGRSYTYTSAPTTTRFVQDTSDENYGWIQYKDENGEWVNWVQAEGTYPLYMTNANEGGFAAYEGKITLTSGYTTKKPNVSCTTTLNVGFSTPNFADQFIGCAISEPVDLTHYGKLYFHHVTSKNFGQGAYGDVKFFITSTKGATMTPISSRTLSGSGNIEIDLSNISGECYIGIELSLYCGGFQTDTIKTQISNMYLE